MTRAAWTRRAVLGAAAGGVGMLVSAPATRAFPGLIRRRGALEGLRVGLVGFGTRGRGHLRVFGYFDTDTGKARFIEHERMPGVEVVAICDTFQDNLDLGCEWVRKAGASATGYVDYREMLAKADLDAVVIATPDHMHAPIAADAMRAGCDVYVEKCLSNNVEETLLLERVAAETGRIVQVGYQLRHDSSHAVAKSLIQQGHIGEVRMVQMNLRRSGDNAGWTDPLAQSGGPAREKIHWEEFLGPAPRVEYDPHRYFEWRRYWDYSTGIAGDILSHCLDSAEMVLDLGMPGSAVASGGIYSWKDGRETPDTFSAVLEYPSRDLELTFSAVMCNGHQPQATLFLGTEGTLELSWKVEVYPDANSEKYAKALASGKAKASRPILSVSDRAAGRVRDASPSELWLLGRGATMTTVDDEAVDTTRLHQEDFIRCVRTREQPAASLARSLPSTIGSHMSTLAYRESRRVVWDAEKRRVV